MAVEYLFAIARELPAVMRSRNLRAADLRMTGRRSFTLQGVTIDLDGRYFSGAREMYCRQVYFPGRVFDLKGGTKVVDLGMNVGLFSVLAAKAGCTVIAVEAQRGIANEARALAEQLGVSDAISIENAMIGAGRGVLADETRLRSATHFDNFVPPVISMKALLQKHGASDIDLMKVDIEGSEFEVFREGEEWLARVRRIVMEVHSAFGDPGALRDLLERSGFQVMTKDDYLFAHR